MLWELFVFGTFWFWLLMVIGSIGIIVFLELDRTFLATIVTIAAFCAVVFGGNNWIFPWVFAHPGKLCMGIGIWLVAAILWAIIKFWFYTHGIDEFIREKQLAWFAGLQHELDDEWRCKQLTVQVQEDYRQTIATRTPVGSCVKKWAMFVFEWEKNRRQQRDNRNWIVCRPLVRPRTRAELERFVDENKSRIISWMTYWPWSLIWTLVNDPIRKIMKAIFRHLRGIFIYIAGRAFGVTKEMPVEETPADDVPQGTHDM